MDTDPAKRHFRPPMPPSLDKTTEIVRRLCLYTRATIVLNRVQLQSLDSQVVVLSSSPHLLWQSKAGLLAIVQHSLHARPALLQGIVVGLSLHHNIISHLPFAMEPEKE